MTIARAMMSGASSDYAIKLLFANGEMGFWYDPSDLSTMYQDTAGTTPCTSAGQTVGKILDKSGNGCHATAPNNGARPILRNSGALWWLEFNGSAYTMKTATVDLSAVSAATFWAGVYKASDAALGVIVESGDPFYYAHVGTMVAYTHVASSQDYGFALAQATTSNAAIYRGVYPYAAPCTNVLSCVYDWAKTTAATAVLPRVNGVVPSFNGDSAVGAVSCNGGNLAIHIGARTNSSYFLNGRLYGLILRGGNSTDAEIASGELHIACKSGVSF